MPAGLIFISFTLLHGFAAALNCTSPTPESLFDALAKDLFPKKQLRPVKNNLDSLNISISVTLVGILGVNEKAQSLTTFLWQVMEWDINGLSWDEKECGAKRVSVPREELWVPDVLISETMAEDDSPKTPYVYLYNTGRVYDNKPMRVVSSCRLVIYTFPFDIQNCTLTFGSFLHIAGDITLTLKKTPAEDLEESKKVIKTKGEWELIDLKAASNVLEITHGSYSEVAYYITLRRRPNLYVVNLLIPSSFLTLLDLFSFLLPPQSVDRSVFKITLVLGYTVFLLIMNDLLPVTGESTPLINVSFSITFALMVLSLLETVLLTNIQFGSLQHRAVPHWLSVLVLQNLAVVVCLPPKQKSNRITVCLPPTARVNASIISSRHLQSISSDTSTVSAPQEPALKELRKLRSDLRAIRLQMDKYFLGSKTSQEWHMIGTVLDRLLYSVYIVFIFSSFVIILVIRTWSNSTT